MKDKYDDAIAAAEEEHAKATEESRCVLLQDVKVLSERAEPEEA